MLSTVTEDLRGEESQAQGPASPLSLPASTRAGAGDLPKVRSSPGSWSAAPLLGAILAILLLRNQPQPQHSIGIELVRIKSGLYADLLLFTMNLDICMGSVVVFVFEGFILFVLTLMSEWSSDVVQYS